MSDNEQLKVVMILPECHPPPWGGTQKQALFLANRLQSQSVGVTVASKRPGIFHGNGRISVKELGEMGIHETLPLVYFPSLRALPAWSMLLSFLVWSVWKRKHFQVIHAHTAATGVIACIAAWVVRKKVVVKFPSMKNVDYLKGSGWMRRLRRHILLGCSGCLVAVNSEMAAALSNLGVPAEKIALIPNGIELNGNGCGTGRRSVKAQLLGDGERRAVLYTGRLIEEKGLERLLAAWRMVPEPEKNLLMIVGDGPLQKKLEATAEELGILPSVRFFGHRGDVERFYEVADLFLMPSRTEGMSNSLLEAMAAGLPVVVSDVGGNRDAVEDGRSGFLVDWDDPVACAAVLSALIENPCLRRTMGQAARERVHAFAMTEISDRYHRLYRAVLAAGSCR